MAAQAGEAADPDPLDRPGRGVVPRRGAGRSAAVSRVAARSARRRRAAVIAVFTIRSDNYETTATRARTGRRASGHAQPAADAEGLLCRGDQGTGAAAGGDTPRALEIEDGLVDALLADIEAGGAKDALPLLAFTLERLYRRIPRRRQSQARALRRARPGERLDRGGGRARVEGGRRRPGDPEGPRRAAGAASPRAHSLAGRHRSRHRRAAPPRRPACRKFPPKHGR